MNRNSLFSEPMITHLEWVKTSSIICMLPLSLYLLSIKVKVKTSKGSFQIWASGTLCFHQRVKFFRRDPAEFSGTKRANGYVFSVKSELRRQ